MKNCKKALSIVLADDSPYIVVKVIFNAVISDLRVLTIIDFSLWCLHRSHYLPMLSTPLLLVPSLPLSSFVVGADATTYSCAVSNDLIICRCAAAGADTAATTRIVCRLRPHRLPLC